MEGVAGRHFGKESLWKGRKKAFNAARREGFLTDLSISSPTVPANEKICFNFFGFLFVYVVLFIFLVQRVMILLGIATRRPDDVQAEEDEGEGHEEQCELEVFPILVLLGLFVLFVCTTLLFGAAGSNLRVLAGKLCVSAVDCIQARVAPVRQQAPRHEYQEGKGDCGAGDAEEQVGDDAGRPCTCVVARRNVRRHVAVEVPAGHECSYAEDEGGEEEVRGGVMGKGGGHHHNHHCHDVQVTEHTARSGHPTRLVGLGKEWLGKEHWKAWKAFVGVLTAIGISTPHRADLKNSVYSIFSHF